MGDINLIPPARIAKRRRRARIRLWAAICGMYLVSLAALAVSAHTYWRDTDDSAGEELAFTTQRVEGYNAKISELKQELAKAQAELEAGKVISAQPDWTKLLVLVGDELKDEVVLENCQLVTTSRSRQDAASNLPQLLLSLSPNVFLAERQYKLELSGFGRTQNSVSQFVLRLEKMKMFDSVELVNSRRKTFLNSEAAAFSIECSI